MRAAPVVEQIIDERWATIGDTINGWRGSMATGRCNYDFALNAANTKNQVGTELAKQVSTSTAGRTPTATSSTAPMTTS